MTHAHDYFILRALAIGKTIGEIAAALCWTVRSLHVTLNRLRRQYKVRRTRDLVWAVVSKAQREGG